MIQEDKLKLKQKVAKINKNNIDISLRLLNKLMMKKKFCADTLEIGH